MSANLNPRWTVKISYAPLTTFNYDFTSLNSARNFAGLMARDNSVKVQLIKNL